jgi:hypothetical protein
MRTDYVAIALGVVLAIAVLHTMWDVRRHHKHNVSEQVRRYNQSGYLRMVAYGQVFTDRPFEYCKPLEQELEPLLRVKLSSFGTPLGTGWNRTRHDEEE